MAVKLEREAAELKAHFNEAFWDEERKFIALALDGKKNQVCIKTSNPGHCLATAILDPEKAAAVARGLMAPDLYSGWGVRTLSQKERRYNPMSYHNGSIWPHDTSIAAMGLALYGHTEAAAKICESIFEASSSFDMQRMPELFCGFDRRKNEAPILYPVACSPQAWAVASVYLILTSLLGIEIYANEKSIRLRKPAMPRFLNELKIERIPLEKGWLGLRFLRYGNDIGVEIMDKPPDWSLIICK
jgi:glycogen debranching enzyme